MDYRGTPESETADSLARDRRVKMAEKEYLNAPFYHRRDLYDSAITYYDFLLELYPETPWALRALEGIYDANGAIGYETWPRRPASGSWRSPPGRRRRGRSGPTGTGTARGRASGRCLPRDCHGRTFMFDAWDSS